MKKLVVVFVFIFSRMATADEWTKILIPTCHSNLEYFRLDAGRLEGGSISPKEYGLINVFEESGAYTCSLSGGDMKVEHHYMHRPGPCSYNRGVSATISYQGNLLLKDVPINDCFSPSVKSFQFHKGNIDICFGEPGGPIFCKFIWKADSSKPIITSNTLRDWLAEWSNS